MRKTFLTICAAAFALLAVSSCGKIWDEFDEVHGQLDSIEARLDSLESSLNGQVATLNTKIGAVETAYKAADADLLQKLTDLDEKLLKEINALASELDALDGKFDGYVEIADHDAIKAKVEALIATGDDRYAELKGIDSDILAALAEVAVTKVEKNSAGNAVLTFLDGSTLEVAANANVNNTGLVTVIDGKWAVVGANGKATVLEDALVHPDTVLEFKVDPETKELLYTLDGETWEKTGAYVADEDYYLVTDFAEGNGFVTLTVGGVKYNLPLVSTNSFEIVSGKVYFDPSETKTVPVNRNGIVSAFVANGPKGWTAKLVDNTITVTAPSGYIDEERGDIYLENYEDEREGTIELWVVTEDGKTLVGRLRVAIASLPATFAVGSSLDSVKVVFSSDYNSRGIFYGVALEEEFDPETLLESVYYATNSPEDGIFTNFDYDSGNYATEAEHSFAELYGSEAELGKTYVIWSIAPELTADWSSMPPTYEMLSTVDDFVLKNVSKVNVTIEKPVVSFDDAEIEITVEGVDRFYAGYWYGPAEALFGESANLSDENLEYFAQNGLVLEDLLVNGLSMGWMTQYLTYGNVFKGEYKGSLSDLFTAEQIEFKPAEEFTLVVLPLPAGKTEFSSSDFEYVEFELNELLYGGKSVVTLSDATDITYSSFDMTISSTGVKTYYGFMSTEEYNDLEESISQMGSEDIVDVVSYYVEQDMFQYLNVTDKDETDVTFDSLDDYGTSLSINTEYTVFAFAIDADGKCTEVTTKTAKTTGLPYSEDLVVSVDANCFNGVTTAKVGITGNATKIYYCKTASVYSADDFDSTILSALNGEEYGWEVEYLDHTNFVNGVFTSSNFGTINNTTSQWTVYAFVEDADGNLSKIAGSDKFSNSFNPDMAQWIIPADNEDWAEMMAPARGVIDLGINMPGQFIVGICYEDIYEDAVGVWQPAGQLFGYKVVPTDASTGVIKLTSVDITGETMEVASVAYAFEDAETCTFDLSDLLGCEVVCTKHNDADIVLSGGIAI